MTRQNLNLPAQTDQTDQADDATASPQNTPANVPHGCTATISAPGGIKRRRSGGIASHQYDARHIAQTRDNAHYYDSTSSSEEDNLSSENSGSESSDDSECSFGCYHEELGHGEETSAVDSEAFRDARKGLLNSSYSTFLNWADSERYVAPPDDRLPPRKRARVSKWQHGLACVTCLRNDTDTEHVAAVPTGYFHLACPFYLANPKRYEHCLLEHDLQSVEAVIRHLRHHHKKPPYCPRCYETFARVLDRDGHILRRKCKLSDQKHIDGLNEYQQTRLSKRDKLYYGEATRWKRIWTTVYPDANTCPGPYLDNGCALRVSLARDYLREHGQRLVSQFLNKCSLDETQARSGEWQVALSKLTSQDLLKKVYDEDKLDQNCGLEIRIKSDRT